MIKCNNIPNNLWPKSISIIVYLKNRSPTKYLEHKTPYEAFYGYKLVVSHLKFFGTKAFSHISKEYKRKNHVKIVKCIFIGYIVNHKSYKMYHPITIKCLQVEMLYFMNMKMRFKKNLDYPYAYLLEPFTQQIIFPRVLN
jgi:hypothetical protein